VTLARHAETASERAGVMAETSWLAPYLEWQSEGFASGFDRRPNAQDTLRIGTTVEPFWSLGRRGAVRDAATRQAEWSIKAARTEIGWRVTELWIEAATLVEQRRLAEQRLKWMEKAIEQQRRRFELGEISGSELFQFEAILVEYRAAMAEVDARWKDVWYRVTATIGGAVLPPQVGDLAELANATFETGNEIETAPAVVAAEAAADLEQARSDWLAVAAWGRPTVEAEWERFPAVDGLSGYDAWGFRVNVPLPLGGAGASHRNARRAMARAAEARAEETARAMAAKMAALEARAAAGEANLQALQGLVADFAQAERSLGEQYRLGELDYVGLLDGLERLDRTRLAEVEARHTVALARLEAQWIRGGPEWANERQAGEEE
jgi:outer membrane protein TolC